MYVVFTKENSGPNVMLLEGAIGSVIGFVITGWYHVTQVKKIKAESIKLAGDHLNNLQGKRQVYNNACKEMTRHVIGLTELLQNSGSVAHVKTSRDETCEVFATDVLPSFCDHCQWEHLDNRHDPQAIKRLINNDILPELARFAKWLTVINRPKIIQALKKTPLRISDRNLEPLRRCVDGMIQSDKRVSIVAINEAIGKLTNPDE